MGDVLVINKVDSATPEQLAAVRESITEVNPKAMLIEARSPVTVDDPGALNGKRVLVIEDGPTLTHGEMRYGAGVVAAKRHGAAEIVDPREYAAGSLRAVYESYDVGPVLPAMGYSAEQLSDMKATIESVPCDVVIVATPIDLRRLIDFDVPAVRVTYDLEEAEGSPTIAEALRPVTG
jgi:predicted GTPase